MPLVDPFALQTCRDMMDAEIAEEKRIRPGRPTHPTTERYTLVTVDLPGGNIEAGVHRDLGEPVAVLRSELRRLVQLAVDEVLGGMFMVCDDTAPRLVDALEAHIQRTWPSRPWWCEVYDESERLTQTYAPYGMPRGSTPR